MSRFIHQSHHVSVLLYHVVCVAKYRRVVFDEPVEAVLHEVCLEIALRFEIEFLEIGLDGDHVHFLVQSVPTYSPTKIVTILKSVTAREVFSRCPQVKKHLWGGEFWSDGYFIASVGQQESEETVRLYVKQKATTDTIDNSTFNPQPQETTHKTKKVTRLKILRRSRRRFFIR